MATRRRCQRKRVSGVTKKADQWVRSRSLDAVARSYLARQGAQQVLEQIRGDAALGDAVVVTGSFAAVRLAPVAAPALLTLYSNDPDALAVALDLLPADEGTNVALLRPYDRVVWDRTSTEDGISYAAPSQVAVDCLTGNGRMLAEGEALLTWMTGNESTWRLPSLLKEVVTPKS